ncbi:FxsA protein [Rhodovulum sp. P5]|uniref:FxsA family protein n=1 Tax=Rhodovulum sp. P5 TaxID=1564506 RepID=UPI0009C2AB0B|nr:FxsA family protein [Rhodovulum sp. P5]ARE40595.1 FxsA protein [Rhodovulum sp. P5]
MWLFLLFLSVPLIEITLFIQVGGLIGLWPTLGIVVLTAILGTWLMRQQGAHAIDQLRRSFQELRDPAEPLAHGAMILFSGALLLTPGFFTDAVGFALLMPPVRAAAYRYLSKRIVVQTMTYGNAPQRPMHGQADVIDGDFEEVPPPGNSPHSPSGWTQH